MTTPKFREPPKQFASNAIHIGSEPTRWSTNDLIPPISLATTYKQDLPLDTPEFHYIRDSNPTIKSFELCMASLEGAKFCLALSSGMSALTTALRLLKKGDHVVTQTELYHGSFNEFGNLHERDIEVDFADATDPCKVEDALKTNTTMVWLETPTNPLMKVVDIVTIVKAVRTKSPNATIVCDNTFMSPYFQQPLALGVDIVMESCTKYISGHSDILMGALSMNSKTLFDKLFLARSRIGCTPSPFACYLALRSVKTLELRMQKHMKNALEVAHFLKSHPAVEEVFHPGLESHPQHKIALRQCSGHSGMMSFYIKGHNKQTTEYFLSKLNFVQIADSLGGTETSVKIPSMMPKGSLTQEEMDKQGITDGLARLSVGLEDSSDIIEDLRTALNEASDKKK